MDSVNSSEALAENPLTIKQRKGRASIFFNAGRIFRWLLSHMHVDRKPWPRPCPLSDLAKIFKRHRANAMRSNAYPSLASATGKLRNAGHPVSLRKYLCIRLNKPPLPRIGRFVVSGTNVSNPQQGDPNADILRQALNDVQAYLYRDWHTMSRRDCDERSETRPRS